MATNGATRTAATRTSLARYFGIPTPARQPGRFDVANRPGQYSLGLLQSVEGRLHFGDRTGGVRLTVDGRRERIARGVEQRRSNAGILGLGIEHEVGRQRSIGRLGLHRLV